ncbi:hypothetical protein KI387_039018, partial [Taxus chinensis]
MMSNGWISMPRFNTTYPAACRNTQSLQRFTSTYATACRNTGSLRSFTTTYPTACEGSFQRNYTRIFSKGITEYSEINENLEEEAAKQVDNNTNDRSTKETRDRTGKGPSSPGANIGSDPGHNKKKVPK